ncbi:MAG: hypothetical protein K0R70_1769 [Steroidobacteraceae bacterium]|nr:hypothetical protein [Steroidobacteraceae bacterium]
MQLRVQPLRVFIKALDAPGCMLPRPPDGDRSADVFS